MTTSKRPASEVAREIVARIVIKHRELNSHTYFEALQDASDSITAAIEAERNVAANDTSQKRVDKSEILRHIEGILPEEKSMEYDSTISEQDWFRVKDYRYGWNDCCAEILARVTKAAEKERE